LPPKPKEVVQRLLRGGFVERDGKGQRIYSHSDGRRVVVAVHTKELKKGTYLALLKQLGLTDAEFKDL
jgi:predicted RNA binding protein YcfA (HicA-like mRNA interferase family)